MTPRKPPAPRMKAAAPSAEGKVSLLERSGGELPPGRVLDFPAPRRRNRLRSVVLAVTAVVLVLGGIVAYVLFSPALALRTIVVEGNALVATEEIQSALEPLKGTSLTRIPPDRVRELLADKTPIEDVGIAAEPPSTLVVTVREREPVAVLQNGADFLLIDAEGRQLASVATRDAVKLPLIDGGTNAVNSAVFSSITAVLAELPAAVLARLDNASAASVDSIRLSLTGDQRIFWGSSERSAEKAQVLEVLLAMPATDPPVKEFDISTPDRPVTR